MLLLNFPLGRQVLSQALGISSTKPKGSPNKDGDSKQPRKFSLPVFNGPSQETQRFT
jgi:hypothetical protein